MGQMTMEEALEFARKLHREEYDASAQAVIRRAEDSVAGRAYRAALSVTEGLLETEARELMGMWSAATKLARVYEDTAEEREWKARAEWAFAAAGALQAARSTLVEVYRRLKKDTES